MFFALSGFLIASILTSPTTRSDLTGFAHKRFWRIMPVLFLAVVSFTAADLILNGGAAFPYVWIPLFALNGYLVPVLGFDTVPFTIVWSFSVELTAYAIFAMIARFNWSCFTLWLWVIVVSAPLLRSYLIFEAQWPENIVATFPPGRLDALALGALAALGTFDTLIKVRSAAWLWGGATIVCLISARFAPWVPHFTETIGLSIFGALAALWVASLAEAGRQGHRSGWAMNLAAKIGLVSYFIYLFHIFVIEGLMMLGTRNLGFWLNFMLASILVTGLAWLSWIWLEMPLISYARGRSKTS